MFFPFLLGAYSNVAVIMKLISEIPLSILNNMNGSCGQFLGRLKMHFQSMFEYYKSVEFQNKVTRYDDAIVPTKSQKLKYSSLLRFNNQKKSVLFIFTAILIACFTVFCISFILVERKSFEKDSISIRLLYSVNMRKTLSTIVIAYINELITYRLDDITNYGELITRYD